MSSAMTQPMILPNGVSSNDWSAAETNLDIVLIQFYRCKLCQNKFSSLSRPVVVAHMMQVHESEWKAACEKVKEVQCKEALENAEKITDGKKHETVNKKLPGDKSNRKNISPRHFFTKHIQGDSMVPRDTSTRKPWKRPVQSKPGNASIMNKPSSGSCSSTGDTLPPGSMESSNVDVISTSQSNTPGVAVFSVKGGIAYVTQVGQPIVNVGQDIQINPTLSEGQSDKSSEQLPPGSESASNNSEEITCKQCGHVCASWIEHWTHSHEHLPAAEKVRYQCQACKLNFGSRSTLQQHQESNPECQVSQTAAGLATLTCSLCSFKTYNNHSLKTHIGSQHKDKNHLKIVYCLLCKARFNSSRSLRRHRKGGKCGRTKRGRPKGVKGKMKPRPRSIPKVIVCDLCNRTFDQNYRYKEHYATHFDERKQQCKECGKAFKTKRGLRNHMKVHKGVKFSCELCDFQSFWSDSVKKHKEMKHFSENLPYLICSMCIYKTKDPNALRTHERYKHREEKEYICETCGKLFKLSIALKYHQETHNNEPQYPCDKCDYMGRTRFSLYSHKSVHIAKEQMQFKCDQCPWIGRRRSELQRHERKHSENKLYYCHHCGLGYKHKHGLTRHLKEKHFGNSFTPVEMSEPDESNIYTDDIIVAQVFEV